MTSESKLTYLKDYQVPAYWIDQVDLDIDLEEMGTRVVGVLKVRRNPESQAANDLHLDGEMLKLLSLKLNGKVLGEKDYQVTENALILAKVPNEFTLEVVTEIHPETNTALSGLYKTGSMFCTQCEAQGFRRILYYPDRPDVMSEFTTKLRADKRRYPVLLANGNLVEAGDLDGNKHFAVWKDPFKKPSYLFAMVAGDWVGVEDHFITCSGRKVTLKIYVERENLDKTGHALAALKKAMQWDEETYGREYDLNIYMVVAVNDFNMGAMENKGLNIFNSKYVLARPETATDGDFAAIDDVVAHEYFHNWSGNRVTCRDWFQLSLKEGFTVFREQHFSRDISKSPVSRIDNVNLLRSRQFSEDSGPMAHPVRPDSYMEINNFYTLTVYEKGAEVIRMLQNLLGWPTFRRGTDLYFERHDGQAATTDDFVKAMEDVSSRDLSQFKLWYTQAGTPEITVEESYDAKTQCYHLTLSQSCPTTPGQPSKKPMLIPVAVGLLDGQGKELPLKLEAEKKAAETTKVLALKKATETFIFTEVSERPVLSILRDFSAPVRVHSPLSNAKLAFLLAHDTDPVNRWDAGQMLMQRTLFSLVDQLKQGKSLSIDGSLRESVGKVLKNKELNPALKSALLTLPTPNALIEASSNVEVDLLLKAKEFLLKALSKEYRSDLLNIYQSSQLSGPYQFTPEAASMRRLKNVVLSYLLRGDDESAIEICQQQYDRANNMTDAYGALIAVNHTDCEARMGMLTDFYDRWKQDPLVVLKWLSLQASSELSKTLEVVTELAASHPAFELGNPNKVYALVGGFCSGNPFRFHDRGGRGYQFLTDVILKLNGKNPQVAARMMSPLTQWKKFEPTCRELMKKCLNQIKESTNLSKDIFEIVTKSLA